MQQGSDIEDNGSSLVWLPHSLIDYEQAVHSATQGSTPSQATQGNYWTLRMTTDKDENASFMFETAGKTGNLYLSVGNQNPKSSTDLLLKNATETFLLNP